MNLGEFHHPNPPFKTIIPWNTLPLSTKPSWSAENTLPEAYSFIPHLIFPENAWKMIRCVCLVPFFLRAINTSFFRGKKPPGCWCFGVSGHLSSCNDHFTNLGPEPWRVWFTDFLGGEECGFFSFRRSFDIWKIYGFYIRNAPKETPKPLNPQRLSLPEIFDMKKYGGKDFGQSSEFTPFHHRDL